MQLRNFFNIQCAIGLAANKWNTKTPNNDNWKKKCSKRVWVRENTQKKNDAKWLTGFDGVIAQRESKYILLFFLKKK